MRRNGEVLTIVGITIILIAVYIGIDPNRTAIYPKCLFKGITGYKCAVCGMQRALYSIMHGNLREAIAYNAVFVASLPVIAVSLIPYKGKTIFLRVWQKLDGHIVIATIIIIIIGWTVIRNIIFV